MHAPILALFFVMARELELGLTSMQLFILGVGLPVSVMASYAFYLVFERPFVTRAQYQQAYRGYPSNPTTLRGPRVRVQSWSPNSR